MKTRNMMIPKLRAEAPVVPNSLDEKARTVEVRFYSGASVQRFPLFDDPYELAFSLDKQSVRLERFNAGAPLVDNHDDTRPVNESILGVVEKAWLAEDGARARVKIAEDRPDIMARLRDGILRNFSMGAVIHQMRDVTEKGDAQRKLLAVDWEPHELSIVPVPADAGAQALAQAERFPCKLSGAAVASPSKEANMKTIKVRLLANIEDVGTIGDIVEIDEVEFNEKLHTKELEPKAAEPVNDRAEELALQEALAADNKRVERLREIQGHFGRDELWLQRHKRLGSTVAQALADARRQQAGDETTLDPRIKHGEDYESLGWAINRMSDALSARALGKECPEPARTFAGSTIAECAYGILEKLGQTRGRSLDPLRSPEDVVKLAMGTTDFPEILANVLNKTLLPQYETRAPTFQMYAQRRDFTDYRAHRLIRAGDFPLPALVGESGEITQGAMGESRESVTAFKYGRILAISMETLVNDDLGAFNDFGGMVARRIRDNENALFHTNCINAGSGLGTTMTDGVAVYNATHANVGTGGALSNTTLNEAFALMAVQTSIDGLKLNIAPRYILTSATSHILARTFVTQINPEQASNVNPWAGVLMPIWDANLTGTRFYVLADPADGSNYIYGTVGGRGPRFEVRQGFEVEGVQVKVVHDFGCGAIDYRYGVTNAGQ